MDDAAVIWLNAQAQRDPRLTSLVSLAAERLAVLEVALMLLLGLAGRRRSAVRMVLAVSAIYVASECLGRAWPRQRPFERLDVTPLAAHEPGRSFPSRHVASGLAMAVIGSREHERLGRVMTTVAVLLGLSRVAAGLHYPSDVAGGAVLGLAIGRYAHKP